MQGWIEPCWLLAFCCVLHFTTIPTSSFAGGDLMLRSKACPIAAGRRSFYSVVVFCNHCSTMGCFRRYIRFVGPKLYLVPALWDAFDVTLICFRQSYPVFFGSGSVRKSVSGVDGDVGGLYVIVYSLAWSTNVSFFRLYHPRLVSFCLFLRGGFCEGDFFCMLAA